MAKERLYIVKDMPSKVKDTKVDIYFMGNLKDYKYSTADEYHTANGITELIAGIWTEVEQEIDITGADRFVKDRCEVTIQFFENERDEVEKRMLSWANENSIVAMQIKDSSGKVIHSYICDLDTMVFDINKLERFDFTCFSLRKVLDDYIIKDTFLNVGKLFDNSDDTNPIQEYLQLWGGGNGTDFHSLWVSAFDFSNNNNDCLLQDCFIRDSNEEMKASIVVNKWLSFHNCYLFITDRIIMSPIISPRFIIALKYDGVKKGYVLDFNYFKEIDSLPTKKVVGTADAKVKDAFGTRSIIKAKDTAIYLQDGSIRENYNILKFEKSGALDDTNFSFKGNSLNSIVDVQRIAVQRGAMDSEGTAFIKFHHTTNVNEGVQYAFTNGTMGVDIPIDNTLRTDNNILSAVALRINLPNVSFYNLGGYNSKLQFQLKVVLSNEPYEAEVYSGFDDNRGGKIDKITLQKFYIGALKSNDFFSYTKELNGQSSRGGYFRPFGVRPQIGSGSKVYNIDDFNNTFRVPFKDLSHEIVLVIIPYEWYSYSKNPNTEQWEFQNSWFTDSFGAGNYKSLIRYYKGNPKVRITEFLLQIENTKVEDDAPYDTSKDFLGDEFKKDERKDEKGRQLIHNYKSRTEIHTTNYLRKIYSPLCNSEGFLRHDGVQFPYNRFKDNGEFFKQIYIKNRMEVKRIRLYLLRNKRYNIGDNIKMGLNRYRITRILYPDTDYIELNINSIS